MITVVMPTYNSEKFVRPAIESILNQTLREIELIVVDDGSSDATPAIIQSYVDSDDRIKFIRAEHGGVSRAMNRGLSEARYEWVAVMHSDDIALPKRLERQYEMTKTDPEVVIWGSYGHHINSTGKRLSSFMVGPTSKEECYALRMAGKVVQAIHPTSLLKRDVVLQVGGYNPALRYGEDIELFDRMLVHGALVTIPEYLMLYRVHGSSLSMTHYHGMITISKYVVARQKQRLDAGTELSLDDFLKQQENSSWWSRLNDSRQITAGLRYRRAGMAYGQRDYVGLVVNLGVAFVFGPVRTVRRLWDQVISHKF